MKTIEPNTLISFAYNNTPDNRYVDILHITSDGFEGIDFSRQNDDDPGYRRFKLDKVNLDTIKVIAGPDEYVIPNTTLSVATMLDTIGLAGQFRLNEEEDVVVIKKSALQNKIIVDSE